MSLTMLARVYELVYIFFIIFMLCITSIETYLASGHAWMSADDVGFDTRVIKSLQLSLYQ